MRRPNPTASADSLYIFGRFTARALDKRGHADIYTIVQAANQRLLLAERKRQDTVVAAEEAYCDRYFAALELDDQARLAKRQLDARSPRAHKEAPSTEVFPKGLEEYVLVSKDKQRVASSLLIERLVTFLPADDPIRLEATTKLAALLSGWVAANELEDVAKTSLEVVKGEKELAIKAWHEAMVTAYAMLIVSVGKDRAEHYFPKARKPSSQDVTPPSGPAPSESASSASAPSESAPSEGSAPSSTSSSDPAEGTPEVEAA